MAEEKTHRHMFYCTSRSLWHRITELRDNVECTCRVVNIQTWLDRTGVARLDRASKEEELPSSGCLWRSPWALAAPCSSTVIVVRADPRRTLATMSTSPIPPPSASPSTTPAPTPAPAPGPSAITTPPSPSSPPSDPPDSAENTLAQLRATNTELQRRRLDAERDRELFREMYSKASAYAGDVSRENAALEERAVRAETQVREGLALVHGTYAGQLAALQAEVARLRGANALLLERDARTGADALRRRAAEFEGVQVENQRMRAELAELRRDYRRMEKVLEQLGERELQELGEEEADIKHTLETTPDMVPVAAEQPAGVGAAS